MPVEIIPVEVLPQDVTVVPVTATTITNGVQGPQGPPGPPGPPGVGATGPINWLIRPMSTSGAPDMAGDFIVFRAETTLCTLPPAGSWPARVITCKNLTGQSVALLTASGDLIDETQNSMIVAPRDAITLLSDGQGWVIV